MFRGVAAFCPWVNVISGNESTGKDIHLTLELFSELDSVAVIKV